MLFEQLTITSNIIYLLTLTYRCFLQFQKNQVLASHSALLFWRQLLQRDFNAQQVQSLGYAITRCFSQMQQSAQEILKASPDDIKFYFTYGMFMIKVMNNDFDGFESFRLAQLKYVGKIEKKEDKRTNGQDESAKIQQSFCDNSSSALIVLSTNPNTFDIIVHANEEVEVVFGYKRKDILDKHISILIPQVIGRHHDNFINKYLNKSRLTFNDRIMSNFAQTKDGMLAPIDILIKIYPRINGDIKLVGIIRRTELNIQGSLSTHSWVESMTQYILTDRYGSITNITQGLIEMLGLHPKFFQHKRVNTLLNIKMDMIAHDALEPKNQQAMQSEGMGLQFDTRNLLTQIDNELISPTEADILRPHLKRVEIFTKIKRLQLSENDFCLVYVLSVVKESAQNLLRMSNSDDRSEDIHHIAKHSLGSSPSSKHDNDQAELNSVSSQQSQYDSFSNIVRDFKKTLTQRQIPMALTNLNRMLVFITLTTLILLILLDNQSKNEAAKVFHLKRVLLAVDTRNLYYTQLAMNMNTFFAIENKMVSNVFSLSALNLIISRTTNLKYLISSQSNEVQSFLNLMIQLRDNEEQQNFEYNDIRSLTVDDLNIIIGYDQPYRVAINAFLNDLATSMKATEENHILPVDYLVVEPIEKQAKPLSPVNFEQKKVYQMKINSLRVLRTYTDVASQHQHEIAFTQLKEDYFLLIMVLSLLIILTSISIVLFQIKRLEVIQRDIVSLYAYISLDRIRDTHNKVLGYLKEIDEGSYLKQIRPLSESFHRWNINLARSNLSLHQYMEEEREDIYSQMIKKANEEVRLMNYKPPAQMAGESERRNSKLVRQKAGPVNFNSTMQTHAPEPKKFQTRALFKKMVKKVTTATKTTNTLKFLTKQPGNPQTRKAMANDFIKTLKQKRLNNLNDVTSNPTLANPKIDAETKMKVMKEVKEQENQAIEQRKQQFNKTYRYINKDRNFSVIFIGVVLVTVYMALYFLNHAFLTDIIYLKDSSLVFFNRYKHLILTFSLSRERIFMNNSMASFEAVPHYGHNLDVMYNDASVLTEQSITSLKLTHNSVLSNMIDQLAAFDSPEFCAHVISTSSDALISINQIAEQVPVAYSGQPVYQSVIDTVGLACEASRRGEIEKLKEIVQEYGINLNLGDYSRQNPLYYAVRARQTEVVRYLIKEAKVQVNIKDIWGSNVIDYTSTGSELESLLLANGAKRLSNQQLESLNSTSQSLQANELRVFYSAYYGSLENILILESQGVSLQPQDPEGRTPLHIAATEGYFDIKLGIYRGSSIFRIYNIL